MGHVENIVEPPKNRQFGQKRYLWKDAKLLLWQRIFGHTVVVIESSLGSPTDIQSTGDVCPGPGEDIAQFVPIVHLLEVEVFHRGSGNDESVELFMAHLLKIAVEGLHVFNGRVFARVRLHLHQVHLQL